MQSNIRTDKDFAHLAGVSRPTMSAYLKNKQKPRRQVLMRIAKATETDLAWLAGDTDGDVESGVPAKKVMQTIKWTKVPSSYGVVADEVELVALAYFTDGVLRLELAHNRHLTAESRIHLAVQLHNYAFERIREE
jgi:transcriptional regulator with XRE-family HTH domain